MNRGRLLLWCMAGVLGGKSLNAMAGGLCQTPANCDDDVFCTLDLCIFGNCQHGHNNAQCNDGVDCNGAETCNSVTDQCQAGTPIQCPPGQFCSTVLDRCVECDNHAHCNDGVFCTGVELCDNGLCVDGTPPDCPDTVCRQGYCNVNADQCDLTPPSSCDDGNGCTWNDTCVDPGGTCIGTDINTISCADNGDCPRGFCRLSVGLCKCTTCTTNADCNDTFPCTTDTCNTTNGTCVFTPSDAACQTNLFCQRRVCDREVGCALQELCTPSDGNPCPTPATCNETTDLCGGCAPPIVSATSRYLRITANPANAGSVALVVHGDCESPTVPCVIRYVDFDSPVNPADPKAGRLVVGAVGKTAAAWGTVMARDATLIRAGASYRMYTECNPGAGAVRSAGVKVTTWVYGDTNGNGVANFIDVTRAVDAFRGFFTPSLTREETDVTGTNCQPNRAISFADIGEIVVAFRVLPYPCAAACP